MADVSTISLDMDDTDSEAGSPSGWLRAHQELSQIATKRKEREKALRASRCFRLLEELVTTERHFVMQLQACADGYETPMRQSHLLHSASPGLVDLLFADLRDVRRMHTGFLNQLEEIWDGEFSRLEALRVEGVPLAQLHMSATPFLELLRSMLEGAEFVVAYTHWYATPLEERQRPLARLVRKDAAVRAMIEQLRQASGGKDVPFFLRLPLRVLPRYNLLLDALANEIDLLRGATTDPAATMARQLVTHLERSEKSMSHMGGAIDAARRTVCSSVHLDILQSLDMPGCDCGTSGRTPVQHVVEARVVTIRNGESGDHGQRSKSEKLVLSSDSADSSGGDATAAAQPSWAGSQASGEICKGLGTFGESRLVLKYLRKTKGAKAELLGRAEMWLDVSLPHLHWVGWLPWEAGASRAYGAGLGAIRLSIKVDIPDTTTGTTEKLKLLQALHAQIPEPRPLQGFDGNDWSGDGKHKPQVSNRSSSPTGQEDSSSPSFPRLRTDEERVIIHLEVQLAVLEEELRRKIKAQAELQQRATDSEAEKELHLTQAAAMQAELEQLRAQVLTRSSSLACVNESASGMRLGPRKRRASGTGLAIPPGSPPEAATVNNTSTAVQNVSAMEELHRSLSQLCEAEEQRHHENVTLSGRHIELTTAAADENVHRLRETQAQLAAAEEKVGSLSRAVAEAEAEAFAERKSSAALRAEISGLRQQLHSISTQNEVQSQCVAKLRAELSDLRKATAASAQQDKRKYEEALALAHQHAVEPPRTTTACSVSAQGSGRLWAAWLAPLRASACEGRSSWVAMVGGIVGVLLVVARVRRRQA